MHFINECHLYKAGDMPDTALSTVWAKKEFYSKFNSSSILKKEHFRHIEYLPSITYVIYQR